MDPTEADQIGLWKRGPLIGSGGFGDVTLWANNETNEVVALKKCKWGVDKLMSAKQKDRWRKEVEIMLRLSHPNVVTCFPVPSVLTCLSSALPLLCMEYCSAGDLRQLLRRPENCCGLEEKIVRRLLQNVTSAMQYLHSKRIIHRDLKPENIVLQREQPDPYNEETSSNPTITFKLIDLGYAKEMDQNSSCSSFVGTFQYVAPELFTSKEYSCTVDYWSLGMVVHECLTGFRPYLPDSSVAKRFAVLEGKSREEICIYVDLDGNIERSCTLASEVHVSKPVAILLEKWLKVLLDWNPLKRGRLEEKGPVVAYSDLENILQSKILSFFCLDTCRVLSYAVEANTSASEVQLWMETDSQIALKDQLVLSWDGQRILDSDGCRTVLDSLARPGSSRIVGVLVSTASLNEGMRAPGADMPIAVEKMLKDVEKKWGYYKLKRIYAASVYFVRKQCFMLSLMFRAKAGLLRHLKELDVELADLSTVVRSRVRTLESVLWMFLQSLDLDVRNGQNLKSEPVPHLREDVLSLWIGSGEGARKQAKAAIEQARIAKATVDSFSEAVSDFDRTSDPVNSNADALNKHYSDALSIFKTVSDLPREERGRESDAGAMISVVFDCLKKRDKIYRDFFASIKKVGELRTKAHFVEGDCRGVLANVDVLLSEIASCQLQRQADMWACFSAVGRGKPCVRTPSVKPELITKAVESPATPAAETSLRIAAAAVKETLVESEKLMEENRLLRVRLHDAITATLIEQKALMSSLTTKLTKKKTGH